MKYWFDSSWVFIAVVAIVLCVFATGAIAQRTEDFKLLAFDVVAGDHFGNSVSISGDIAIVGAPMHDDNSHDAGSAYIYRKTGATWVQEAKLLVSDGALSDLFGVSVSISGDVVIVGAHLDDDNGTNSGSAYIYRFNGLNWVEEAKLIASDGSLNDQFGYSVSINGDVACIGAYRVDDNGTDSGSAYIFRFNPDISGWTEEAKLLASDGEPEDRFGMSVSISGTPGHEVVIMGAHLDSDNGLFSGSAYIYRFNPGTSEWIQETKLLDPDGAEFDRFGWSVSISGPPGNEIAIVGAPNNDDFGLNTGSAFIYRYNGTNWEQEAKLLIPGERWGTFFGISVSISSTAGNEVALIGAFRAIGGGAAFMYRFNPDTLGWDAEVELQACSGAVGDNLGWSVSISGSPGNEIAIAGAWWDDDNGTDSGSAYIFELANTPCPGDFNNSGTVNVFDLLTLLTGWGANPGSPADTDCDGSVNVTDLLALLAGWGDC